MAHLSLCGIDELTGALTEDPSATNLRLAKWGAVGETWPYFQPNWSIVEELRARHGVEEVIAFVCTGWAYDSKAEFSTRSRAGLGTIHLVPYSEHSSFTELLEYVAYIKVSRHASSHPPPVLLSLSLPSLTPNAPHSSRRRWCRR